MYERHTLGGRGGEEEHKTSSLSLLLLSLKVMSSFLGSHMLPPNDMCEYCNIQQNKQPYYTVQAEPLRPLTLLLQPAAYTTPKQTCDHPPPIGPVFITCKKHIKRLVWERVWAW